MPIDFQPGKYVLPIGAVEIDKNKKITVNYYDISADFAEPHLIKGLFSHLTTSGVPRFMEPAGDKGKLISFTGEAGKYSLALIDFLKLIADEVNGYKAKVNFHHETQPGLTRWFILSIWKDTIDKAGGHKWIDESWYKYERIHDVGLLKIDCGGDTLGIARSEKTLKIYENWHKELRIKYAAHPSAKNIFTKNQEISDIVQEIRQRLQEFSDMEQLPGHYELC